MLHMNRLVDIFKVHLDVWEKILVEPVCGELEVVERSSKEVQTTSAFEVLEAK